MKSLNKQKKRMNRSEVLVTDTLSQLSEAYQHIQVNLDFASIDKKNKVIAVTSSAPGEGKSSTLVNLAYIYSKRDSKVLIVDLDLRRPSTHHFFKLVNELGVSDFCSGKAELKDIIRNSGFENLDIITAGSHTPFPSKVVESKSLENLIDSVKDKYDYIFIDTPPVLAAADSVVASRFVDIYVLVAYYGVTKKTDFEETVSRLNNVNAQIAGVVFTNVKNNEKGYYYGYNYSSER